MIHPHLLHSLGKLYHEEALQKARVSHLSIGRKQAAGRAQRSRPVDLG